MEATLPRGPAPSALSSVVDLDRFPLHRPGSAGWRARVAVARAELADDGCSVLRAFLRPAAVDALRAEACALAPRAHVNDILTNAYSTLDDPSLPEDHPVRLFMERTNAFVPSDCIPADSGLRRLYHARRFQRFVAECLGEPELHEYADPLAGLVLNVLKLGCEHPWHYDTNELIVSTLLDPAERGGVFEYCPGIRAPGEENHAAVGAVIRGEDRSPVKRLELRPGDLQLFRGRFSLHRVTRVEGAVERISAILAYAREPGFVGQLERTRQLFGRVTEVHRRAALRPRADGLID